jgi:hypothetical protein
MSQKHRIPLLTESGTGTMGKFSQKIHELPRAKLQWVKEVPIPKNNYELKYTNNEQPNTSTHNKYNESLTSDTMHHNHHTQS